MPDPTPPPSRDGKATSPAARPQLVALLGVLNTVMGAAGLIGALWLALQWMGHAPGDGVARLVQTNLTARRWLFVGMPLGLAACVSLLIGGIGLLMRKRWALKWTLYYAASAIGLIILALIVIPSYFGSTLFSRTGAATAVFQVTLSHPGTAEVTVKYATADGTALAGADYEPASGELTIPAGQLKRSIKVPIVGDHDAETPLERFALQLTAPAHATLDGDIAEATIADDDGPPAFSVADVTVNEGHRGITEAVFDVRLERQSIYTNASVDFATVDESAVAGRDYDARHGTLTFAAGQTRRTITIIVRGDTEHEGEAETLRVVLTNAVNARIATAAAVGTITDDDGPPMLRVAGARLLEGHRAASTMDFNVSLSRPSTRDVTLAYWTEDASAQAGSDYLAASGTVTIAVGRMSETIKVPIQGDSQPEPVETFRVLVADAVNATLATNGATGTILDDDDVPAVSVDSLKLVEGDRVRKPEAATVATLRNRGILLVAVYGLLYPILILLFASRSSFLTALHIDLSERFPCGSLSYTKVGLFILFSWLLWGDFVYTLMEAVVPAVLPLNLKPLGASNTLISIIMTTLPGFLNVTVCPWVSFKSDRFRSRWGRRIPFILWTMPFLVASLVMLGWSVEMAAWVRSWLPVAQAMPSATLTVVVIAILMVVFQFFNMFVSSVFWYLFNDVVPPQFLARFFGLFRLVGVAAAAVFQGVIFKHSETHMREILTGGALLYLVGFGIVCLMVREGDYPPPPEGTYKRKGFISDLRTYGKECFTCRFYWYLYLFAAFGKIGGALALFNVFFSKQMNLSLDQIGKMAMVASIASVLATYFTAVLVDRWHPLRIITYEKIFSAFGGFGSWIWLFVTLPGSVYFWLGIGGTLVSTFNTVLTDTAGYPLYMRLFPKSRYGQFSSAAAMVRSGATIIAGVVAGLYMDLLKWLCHGSDFSYRLAFTWLWISQIAGAIVIVLAYREWKRLGGDQDYRPPAPWTPSGREESVDKVRSSPGNPRLVIPALYIGIAASLIAVALAQPAFLYLMHQHGLPRAFWWTSRVFLPVQLAFLAASFWQLASIKRDLADLEQGRTPRFGIPHYGVFMVTAITGLLYQPVSWLQTGWLIHLDMEREIIVFGINSIPTGLVGLAVLQTIRWVEREPKGAATATGRLATHPS